MAVVVSGNAVEAVSLIVAALLGVLSRIVVELGSIEVEVLDAISVAVVVSGNVVEAVSLDVAALVVVVVVVVY